jgi:hypothetical protein
MKRRKVAFLGLRGTDQFPRFIITENGGTVWTGEGWCKDQKKAVLFAHPGEASRASQDVMRKECEDLPSKEHVTATLNIEVHTKAGVDLDDLRNWLVRAAQFNLAYGTYGSGPTRDSVVLVNVDFFNMKRFENTDGATEEST